MNIMLQAGDWDASCVKNTCYITDLLFTFSPGILIVFISSTKFTCINQQLCTKIL